MKLADKTLKNLRDKIDKNIDDSVNEESKGLELVPLFEGQKEEFHKKITAPETQIVKIFDEEIKKCLQEKEELKMQHDEILCKLNSVIQE